MLADASAKANLKVDKLAESSARTKEIPFYYLLLPECLDSEAFGQQLYS